MVTKKAEPETIDLDAVKDGFKLAPGQFLQMSRELDPKLFVYYDVEMRFRERLYGGVPKDPKIVQAWLAKKTGFDDELTKAQLIQSLNERGVPAAEGMTQEEMEKLVDDMADKKVNGFKLDDHSIYIESRQIIAAIKESTNILWSGERWGPTRKGPKAFVSERVYIPTSKVRLLKPGGDKGYITEPDGVETNLVHTTGPAGRVSAFTRSEYVDGAHIKFILKALRGHLEVERFVALFLHIGENGLGAARSQGKGKCDVLSWEEIDDIPEEEVA